MANSKSSSDTATTTTTIITTATITITALDPHIIQSHILTRLDGPTLASAASSASILRPLSTDHHLWRKICTDTWPSLEDPLADSLISTFPGAHRSVFSDSFPTLHSHPPLSPPPPPSPPPPELVSAVDLYYKGNPIFSRTLRTGTQGFLSAPFWVISLLDPDEDVPTPVKMPENADDREWLEHVEKNLGLSWIVIDPALKRTANLSSRLPVSVRWLLGEVELVYAVVMGAVLLTVKVTCYGTAGGEMHVRVAYLTMEDADERIDVTGKDGMVILQGAMENGKRKKVDVKEAKTSFERFQYMKRKREERRLKREGCNSKIGKVASTIGTWAFYLVYGFLATLLVVVMFPLTLLSTILDICFQIIFSLVFCCVQFCYVTSIVCW